MQTESRAGVDQKMRRDRLPGLSRVFVEIVRLIGKLEIEVLGDAAAPA